MSIADRAQAHALLIDGQDAPMAATRTVHDPATGMELGGKPFVVFDDADLSPQQRDRVHGFVERALAAGATAERGGELPDGLGAYYPPTVITGAAQESEIVQNEVFRPVVANGTRYGLAASAWTRDVFRAQRAAREYTAVKHVVFELTGAPRKEWYDAVSTPE